MAKQGKLTGKTIAEYNQKIQKKPNDAKLYYGRGNLYFIAHKEDKAIEDYTKAIQLNPDYVQAYFERGKAYYNNGYYDNTIADFTNAVKLDPNFAEVFYLRGITYFTGKNDEDKAIADFTKAIKINKEYTLAYHKRGNAYLCKKDYESAMSNYKKVIELDPNNANAYKDIGDVYDKKDDIENAIKNYTKAIDINKKFAIAYFARGLMYSIPGPFENGELAIKDLEKALSLNLDNRFVDVAKKALNAAQKRLDAINRMNGGAKNIINNLEDMNKHSVNEYLDKVEKNICIIENNIFGDPNVNATFGEFSVSKIKEKMSLIQDFEDLEKIRQKSVSSLNNRGYGELLNNLGLNQGSGSPNTSLPEKKLFYYKVFDQMNENINNSKILLNKAKEEYPRNERVKQLFERCKKCDKEVDKLRRFVRDFGNVDTYEESEEEEIETAQKSQKSKPSKNPATINAPSSQAVKQKAPHIDMVHVLGGSFKMGNIWGEKSEKPVHNVKLSSFYMGRFPVTQEQWEAVMGSNPSEFTSSPASGEVQSKRPVECVSWYNVLVFCNKLSMMEGLSPAYIISGSTNSSKWGTIPTNWDSTWDAVQIASGSNGYRLPSEAQWEYAARGGDSSPGNYKYSGSNRAGDVAWYKDNSGSRTHEVGKKAPNSLGLYDMSGNVFELCWDWYGNYSNEDQTDPMGASSGTKRVARGGGWGASIEYVRSAVRSSYNPHGRYAGFRLVRP
ncbi:SUMF1/EgtB/PvdO family nonheme iron enzyme [Treponema sp. R80B11-R83G3]